MADYYTVQQPAQRAKVTETTILELEKDGLLQRTAKNGRIFFSSRQEYLLRAASVTFGSMTQALSSSASVKSRGPRLF